jgi:hypothetical protein
MNGRNKPGSKPLHGLVLANTKALLRPACLRFDLGQQADPTGSVFDKNTMVEISSVENTVRGVYQARDYGPPS